MCESRGIVRASGRTPTTSIPSSSEYIHTRGTRSHAHRPGFRLYTTTAVREPWYCQHTANILPTLALRVTDAGVMIVHGTERQSTTDQTDLTPIGDSEVAVGTRVCELRINALPYPLRVKHGGYRSAGIVWVTMSVPRRLPLVRLTMPIADAVRTSTNE